MADPKPADESLENQPEEQVPAATPEFQPPAVPPPLAPEEEVIEHEGRRWPLIAGSLIVALVIAFLLLLAARAVYRVVTDDNEPNPAPTAPVESPDRTPDKPKPAKKPGTTPSTGAIAETGPGSTAAIFMGTAFAAGAIHYIYTLRRTAKQ